MAVDSSVATDLSSVQFTVNGQSYTVDQPSPTLTLYDWLHSQPGLKGTKRMCGEGGCGACLVTLTHKQPSGEQVTHAINACQYPVASLDGSALVTVEGLGSQENLHPIQQRMIDHNGSQCGFCTPGMIMNMYSLLSSSGGKVSAEMVESAFDGNICRCTGYRSILDAMKSLAQDAEPVPIEELPARCTGTCKDCPMSGQCHPSTKPLHIVSKRAGESVTWDRPTTLQQLAGLIHDQEHSEHKVRFVAGDTGKGVYKNDGPFSAYIDLKAVPDLHGIKEKDGLVVIGSCVTLAQLVSYFQTNAEKCAYFSSLATHLMKVANSPIRNVATWAGNLMLALNHDGFPSDVVVAVVALGAHLTLMDGKGQQQQVDIMDFLDMPLSNQVILSMTLPLTKGTNFKFSTERVTLRHENCHAYVNAAFAADVDATSGKILSQPTLVFGGIHSKAVRASKTEQYIVGKSMFANDTLQGALAVLKTELDPVKMPTQGSTDYRKHLLLSLFYKFFLRAAGAHISPRNASAIESFQRGVSHGQQTYSTDKSQYPLTEPLHKLEAAAQVSGEAVFVADIPILPNEVCAHFVLATQAPAKLVSIDATHALAMPGVLKFLTAKDVPGKNSFASGGVHCIEQEEIFASNEVLYAGQAIGLIVADSEEHAQEAAKKVLVTYESTGKPILSISEAVEAKSFYSTPPDLSSMAVDGSFVVGDSAGEISKSAHKISGQVSIGTQYHFYMETQSALCVPLEDGMDVYSSTQWAALVQSVVAQSLAMPANRVNVFVKRCGGGFGGKLTKATQIAAAGAISAKILKRPVRIQLDLDTNMRMVGKRWPWMGVYEVGFSDGGKIGGVSLNIYADGGCTPNDHIFTEAFIWPDNAYNIPAWHIVPKLVFTNTPSNTFCRSPGGLPIIFMMESIIEHVAKSLAISPDEVRAVNMYKEGDMTPSHYLLTPFYLDKVLSELNTSAEIAERQKTVTAFNKANRWKKRGLSTVPINYTLEWARKKHSALVAIYAHDGSVAITHSGIEIGQGMNTKVAQAAAHTLKIPYDLVTIKTSETMTSANASLTGASVTTEMVCMAVVNACKELSKCLQPVRETMQDASWVEIVKKANGSGIDLSARGWYVGKVEHSTPVSYTSYGAGCAEVELDVLTGETNIARFDIVYDCGQSVNPQVDVGQVEGAVVMGIGNFLMEGYIYDRLSGQALTHNTWEYKVPLSGDIPADLRITLLQDVPNPVGILSSKAVGEPPLVTTCSFLFAAKRCVESARAEIQLDTFFPLDAPATPEILQEKCLLDVTQFTL